MALETTQTRRYRPPASDLIAEVSLSTLLVGVRAVDENSQARLPGIDEVIYCAGDVSLVKRKCIAIVGSRKASAEGRARARKIARQLVDRGIVVVSGLAEGIDVNAHQAAIDAGGKTIAVVGTPLDRVYPAKHAELQERIYGEHLLVSQFHPGSRIFPSNFLDRNKLMAALCDASCVVEAGETSGSLSQARETLRLGRTLFLLRSVVDNPSITWPKKFIESRDAARVRVVDNVEDVVKVL